MKRKGRLINIWEHIVKGALENLNVFGGMIDFTKVSIFIMFLTIGFQGIRNNLFNGLFEVFVVLGLILIFASTLKLNFYNGYLGSGNFIFLCLGVITGITGDFSHIKTGYIIVAILAIITVLSITYNYFRENEAGGKNGF